MLKKKFLSLITGSFLAVTFLSSFKSFAYSITENDSNYYSQNVESYNNSECLEPLPSELVEMANEVIDLYYAGIEQGGKITKVWKYKTSDCICVRYFLEIEQNDLITFKFNLTDDTEIEDVIEDLRNNLGYNENVEIYVPTQFVLDSPFLQMKFLNDNHQLNYMIGEKAEAVLNKKYDVTRAWDDFNMVSFIEVSIAMDYVNTLAVDIEKMDLEYLKNECYINIDTETGEITPDEDFTEIDKLNYLKYLKDNFNNPNATVYYERPYSEYYLCSSDSVCKGEFLDNPNAKYVEGDANNDGDCTIADAVAILQCLANSSKYPLSAQGEFNADFDGDGITGADALTIQKMDAMK